MNAEEFEQLKKDYLGTPIPEELDPVVKKALKKGGINVSKYNSRSKALKAAAVFLVASLALLIVGVNTSPVFAQAMLKIPLVGSIVEVVTFREYKLDEDTFKVNIKVPAIKGLENKDLENSLNEKYLQEDEKLYAQFQTEMEDIKAKGGGHLGVDSGYVVKADNERILSIGRYVVNTVGSSSTTFQYDTIDKKKKVLLTLPSLFKDDSYVNVISDNIKSQMLQQHQADENKTYWVKGIETEGFEESFEKISPKQNFYINSDNKLVISFDKYEVAPGYMGVVDFVIPTEVIADILVGNEYIN
ncbi:DUF3298 domain-containing protein [Desulfosporosinus sp. PR]|uniref:RsiV family protein n=1 Tax=Candidatus Desulfosporosinus nitrosoreducens TaxID=3401928 RepID=UPI0027E757F4|nr:DUF3298 domain-containing protein [Desulfosporosinus sp. PR]MDQ7096395.1 DUF3298 domain-containing protein [Desulfosporosinus sp. PR]